MYENTDTLLEVHINFIDRFSSRSKMSRDFKKHYKKSQEIKNGNCAYGRLATIKSSSIIFSGDLTDSEDIHFDSKYDFSSQKILLSSSIRKFF